MSLYDMNDFVYKVKVSNPTQAQKYDWFNWCKAHIDEWGWDMDSMVFLKESDATKFKEHFGVEL
jgi:hypothetical protein